jgi:hypothetical protein
MSDFEKQQSIELKQHQTLSTLQLWQAHLRALRRASDQTSHTVAVFDTSERTHYSVLVKLTNDRPTAKSG